MPSPRDTTRDPVDPRSPDDVLPAGGGHLPGLDKPPVDEPADDDGQRSRPGDGTTTDRLA